MAGILFFGLDGCAKRNLEGRYINLPGGYKTTEYALPTLQTLAGIHAGTIKLGFEIKDGIITRKPITKGNYDLKKNPESIEKIVFLVDGNKDRTIDYKEAKFFQLIFYNNLIKLYFGNK